MCELTKDTMYELIRVFVDSEEIKIVEESVDHVEYFDNENEYSRIYYYPESITMKHIRNILLVDSKVKNHINIDRLTEFILNEIDINGLIVCRNIVLAESLQRLNSIFSDEYALDIADGVCGRLWTDRQIIVINVCMIKQVCDELLLDDADFLIGLLSTLFHESRHLIYECNELLSIGSEEYPWDGGIEDNVEEYGNAHAEQVYRTYLDLLK